MMTNELKVYETSTLSTRLAKLSDKVISCYGKIEENFFTIAKIIGDIKTNALYEKDFNTFEEYTKEVFGFKKSFAYELAKIGIKFTLPESSHSIFYNEETGEDFKQSQLAVLIRLDVNQVQEGLESGRIGFGSTVKDIRNFVVEVKNAEKLLSEPTEIEPTEIEPTEIEPTETKSTKNEADSKTVANLKAIKEALHNLTEEEYNNTPERPKAILFEVAKLLSNYNFD